MATVIYDGKRLIPAPLINISKQYQKSGNGEIVGKIYSLTITGTMMAYMGSPKADGSFWTGAGYPPDEVVPDIDRLSAIQRKQEAIRNLFSVEGLNFEVQGGGGKTAVRCYPRVVEISFPEGIWYERCEYSITLECDELYGDISEAGDDYDQYISDASEEWSIETNEGSAKEDGDSPAIPLTYALSHTVSATGKRFYNNAGIVEKEPWEQAKIFVLSKLGFDSDMTTSLDVLNIPVGYTGWNHVRSENIDRQGGSYSVTENWLLSNESATEDFSISISDGVDSAYKSVTIDGTVTGYDQIDETDMSITTSKYDNAKTKFATVGNVTQMALTRAQLFSELILNIVPLRETVGRNPKEGTITYSYEYNTRPSTLIEGAKSESIVVSDSLNGQGFAAVFVLGRAKGPVLQDLGTKPASTRSLSIEVVFAPTTFYPDQIQLAAAVDTDRRAKIADVVNAVKPDYTPRFQGPEESSYSVMDSRYTFGTTWTFDREADE